MIDQQDERLHRAMLRIEVLQCGLAEACALIESLADSRDHAAHEAVVRLRQQITWKPDEAQKPVKQDRETVLPDHIIVIPYIK
jgi:hypothetical protein